MIPVVNGYLKGTPTPTPPSTIPLTVVNPDAETGNATGWTGNPSLFTASTLGPPGNPDFPGPHSGTYYFYGDNAATRSMYQDIDVSAYATDIDAGVYKASLKSWIAGDAGLDQQRLVIQALSAASAVLDQMIPPVFRETTTWTQREILLILPVNTRKIRIFLEGFRSGTTSNDSDFDDVEAALVSFTGDTRTDYAQSISTGNRAASITVTSSGITAGAGSPSALVDGSQSNTYWWQNGTGNGTQWIKFDFGSGNDWIINEFRWYQDVIASHGTWRLEGSNDDSSWTQIGSDFTLAAGMIKPGANTTAYRYYRLRHMSGSRVTTPFNREIEFKAAP